MPNGKKKKSDHLIWNLETGKLECRNCGTTQGVSYPIGLTIFIAMMKAFEKAHKHCQKPTNEDPGILPS